MSINLGYSFLNSQNNQLNDKNMTSIGFITIKKELIYLKQYQLNQSLKNIISDFVENITEEKLSKFLEVKTNFNKYNLTFYDINSKKIDKKQLLSMSIEDLAETVPLINMEYNGSSSTGALSNKEYLKIVVKYENLIAEDFEKYILNNMNFIGKPILNKKAYLLFNYSSKNIKVINYPQEDLIFSQINKFSSIDTYCNAKNNLFIYEGIPNDKEIEYSKFYSINLIKNKITLISLNFPKRILHSMIYIPENYIFIIGGKTAKKVIIYNIENNKNGEYDEYPHLLPKELYEPSLISINSKYIYILENSTVFLNIFRINILTFSPFESIKVRESKNIQVPQKFFGVVKNKNSILFLGGQMLNTNINGSIVNNCFEFNFDNDILTISNRKFIPYKFTEKTFLPIDNDIYAQFAEYKKDNKNEIKIIQFDAKVQEIENGKK